MIGISDEQEELRQAVRGWAARNCPPEVPRALLDVEEAMPPFWSALAEQGWLALPVGLDRGGQGASLVELAVVVEELGRTVAPGPFLPTALAVAIVDRHGGEAARKLLLPGLMDGSTPAAVAFDAPDLGPRYRMAADGSLSVSGVVPAVLGGGLAHLLLVAVRPSGAVPARSGASPGATWVAIDLVSEAGAAAAGVTVRHRATLDPTRRCVEVALDEVRVSEDRVLDEVVPADVANLASVLAAAELTGSARWCLDTATEHARTRVQFGRPIGQFQAVKHRLANLLIVVEQMTALAWDAAQALEGGDPGQATLAATAARGLCLDGGVRAAQDAIQVLGGLGYTWEHDAHLHLRRSGTWRQLLGGSGAQSRAVARLALAGTRRTLSLALPERAEGFRQELAPVVAAIAEAEIADRTRLLGTSGLLFPHWPAPYGRNAGAVEQLVIDELLGQAGIRRPPADVKAWALPTLIAHGTVGQQERWIMPTLEGKYRWCQLFSEPGAGSDLAALSMRATRTEGGWLLQGQKVWTSVAAYADWGICLARTDAALAKHRGITYFIVDMKTPGIDVRPLREITGDAMFNEVFFDEVFVPDDCVVGEVNDGWRLARTTLSNERISLATSSSFGGALEGILLRVGTTDSPPEADGGSWDVAVDGDLVSLESLESLGSLLIEAQSLAVLSQRTALRAVTGAEPGPEASIRKLLAAEHSQRVADFGIEQCGVSGVFADGASATWVRSFLESRYLTIAGGTSEVQRNVIGERLLGLPRDPEPVSPTTA